MLCVEWVTRHSTLIQLAMKLDQDHSSCFGNTEFALLLFPQQNRFTTMIKNNLTHQTVHRINIQNKKSPNIQVIPFFSSEKTEKV